jgi:hypothetical protein
MDSLDEQYINTLTHYYFPPTSFNIILENLVISG